MSPIRLVTLGTLRLDGNDWRPAKALTLLTYLSLQGPTSRRRLRELFWPQARDAGASLRVVLGQFRRHLPGVVRGDEMLEAEMESDAAHLLGLGEWRGDAADAETYAGPFLAGAELSEGSAELEEWVLVTRERLAGAARLAMLRAAELAGSPAGAAHWTERAAAIAEAQPPEPELLERMLRLTLPGSLLEAELRIELVELTVAVPRISLPVPEQELLGREREVGELLLALADPAVRLLEITGPGGIGKSTLATALLREQADLSGVQVLSVALESALASSEAAARMVVALGLQVTDRGDGWLALARAWGERPLLALLDGVEGLPDLGKGIATLLTHCPGVRLVITSRVQRLTGGVGAPVMGNGKGMGSLPGAVHLALDGLSVPAPGESPARMARCAAVQLFVRGARRYLPRFAADEQNAPLVSAIVRRLDGHPLATVLSATWMRVYPPAQIHTLILQDLAALRAEDSAPERHQLSAVFERSWQLLTPGEAQAVSALAVFQGFTPEAALRVAGVSPALLESLMAHSLLRTLPQGRLEVPPVLAAQAQAHLPDADAVQDAHAGYYLEYLMGHAPESDEVDTERANVVAAVAYSLSRGRDTPGQIDTLLASYDRRGLLDSGIDAFYMFRETLAAQESASAGSVLVGLAWLAHLACRYREAETVAAVILQSEQVYGPMSVMKALNVTAISMVARGIIAGSLEFLNRAIVIATMLGQEARKIMYSLNLSETYIHLGRYAEATVLLTSVSSEPLVDTDLFLSMCTQAQFIRIHFYSRGLPDARIEVMASELLYSSTPFKHSHTYLVMSVLLIKTLIRQKKTGQATAQLGVLTADTESMPFDNIKTSGRIMEIELHYLLARPQQARSLILNLLNEFQSQEVEDGLYDLILACAEDLNTLSPEVAVRAIALMVFSRKSSDFQQVSAREMLDVWGQRPQGEDEIDDKNKVISRIRDVFSP